MKLALGLLSGLLLTFTVSADVVVYTQRINVTSTGAGSKSVTALTGYYVWEIDTGLFYNIDVTKARKRFSIHPPVDSDIVSFIDSGFGSDVTLLGYYLNNGLITAKGTQTTVDIGNAVGTANRYLMPRSLKVAGIDPSFTEDGQKGLLDEYAGTLTFDTADTKAINKLGLSLDEAAEKIRAYLVSIGYTEE